MVHSFRRGTGKSNLVANLAVLMAQSEAKVGVIDLNFLTPSLAMLFGLDEDQIECSLNDYLWGRCRVTQLVHSVLLTLPGTGKFWEVLLASASSRLRDVERMLQRRYNFEALGDLLVQFSQAYALDVVLMDTPAGITPDTLSTLAYAQTLLTVLHTDQQDYQGTAVLVDIANRYLNIPRQVVVLNDAPLSLDVGQAMDEIRTAFNVDEAWVLPHSDELASLASADLFVLKQPLHPLTLQMQQLAQSLLS
jgi:MinD-like ATPase involved in chromosome partitioning or flagellar assembly